MADPAYVVCEQQLHDHPPDGSSVGERHLQALPEDEAGRVIMSTDSPALGRGRAKRTKRSQRRWRKAWRIVNRERSQLLEDAGLC